MGCVSRWRDQDEIAAGLPLLGSLRSKTVRPVIWLFLALVLVAHEASHALALWAYRIRFAPRVWYSRDFPWLGFGWMYFVDGIDPRQRHAILVVGPLVEAILWSLGALLFPEYFLGLILMAGGTLLLNRFVPGGDLWKAQRLPKTAQSLLAEADGAPGPRGLPAPSSEG